jgi:hypothetical protein
VTAGVAEAALYVISRNESMCRSICKVQDSNNFVGGFEYIIGNKMVWQVFGHTPGCCYQLTVSQELQAAKQQN